MTIITSFKQFLTQNTLKATELSGHLAGKAYSSITQTKRTDLIGQISILASCALGLYLSATGANTQERVDGLLAAGVASSLSCLGWALAKGAQGDSENASKLLLVAGAIGGVTVGVSHLDFTKDANHTLPFQIQELTARQSNIQSIPITSLPLNNAQLPCFPPKSMEEKVQLHLDRVDAEAQSLVTMVEKTIRKGGRLVPAKDIGTGTSGVYFIKDKSGKTVAFFKPADEGTWKPNCPNAEYRKDELLNKDDIYFHKLNSWEQGKAPERQQLALLLNFGKLNPPKGAIVEITSPLFFDSQAEVQGLQPLTKKGYLQEWIPNAKPLIHYHPSALKNPNEIPPMEALNFDNNPLLSQIPLNEFQEQGIYDLILCNEDRNVGNLLVIHDEKNVPHMRPIDNDAIFPWKLKKLLGISTHENAKKPFTQNSLKLIDSLDSELIRRLVDHADLSEQASLNAKAVVVVLKKFADKGGSLNDVYQFVAARKGAPDDETSQLWQWMEKAQELAKSKLSPEDQKKVAHNHFIRRSLWCNDVKADWCKTLSAEEEAKGIDWQKKYQLQHAHRIGQEFQKHFWNELSTFIDNNVERLAKQNNWTPPCKVLGKAKNVCWKVNELAPGITHHKFEGTYANKKQRFEMLKVADNSKGKLVVQDARGVFKADEKPHFGRLQLSELASRVPNAIAALSGGNFHYIPPKGEYYEWQGTYQEGDLLGETIVNGKIVSENPNEKLWGAMRIDQNDQFSIVDTGKEKLSETNLPKYSLGAVPILVKDGKPVTMEELGPGLALKPKQAPTPGIQFRTHIGMSHARVGVCEREDDKLLVLIEGRQEDAVGLNMPEFANLLKDIGCKNALNLDGGGTADLVTKNEQGHFVTSVTPSDKKGKRPVASSVVITLDE